MNNLIRLNKYLSECGICSRRKADEHICAGHVSVNGEKAEMGQKINPETDKIMLEGKKVQKSSGKFIYYALNKPKGVISTASDEINRKSVIDLVPAEPRVYPVGRLDKDSEGLILLTNDGEITQKLTHPSSEHEKEYVVITSGKRHQKIVVEQVEAQLLKGIKIDGVVMKADTAKLFMTQKNKYMLILTIHTGHNRQIRKMCDKINLEVIKLKRIRIGKLKLEDLDLLPGDFKEIKKTDIV